MNSNKKRVAFTLLAFVATVLLTLTFTACPKATQGGEDKKNENALLEGVWKAVSGKMLGENGQPFTFPLPEKNGGTKQPFICFSQGKAYGVKQIEGKTKPEENGLFKDIENENEWGFDYTYKDGTIEAKKLGSAPCKLEGDKITITMSEGGTKMD